MDINITKELTRFKKHIEISSNSRIFFSGIFGIGKTHFLKEYFKSNNLYECVILRPVNYSIASNKDIMDYIKYDIIFELFKKNIEFEKTDISKYLSAQYYVKDNFIKTASTIAKMAGQIGKPIANILDGLQELNENIENHNQEVQIDQKKETTDFLNKIKEKDGSIYEENNITELISSLVQSLKVSEDEDSAKKETVLIIDDLDRLDPEHIFRILNVFACHFDLDSSDENKFGFDKVVVVGDSENVRNIFQAKYGIDTDFNGYIDKFYSSEIYKFDNKSVLKGFLSEFLAKLKIGQSLYLGDSRSVYYILLMEILRKLIDYNLLSLRTIQLSLDKNHQIEQITFTVGNDYKRLTSVEVIIITLFKILISIYGSKTALEIALKKLAKKNPLQILSNSHILEPILCLLDCKTHKGDKGAHSYVNSDLNLKIDYLIDESMRQINLNIEKISYLDKSQEEITNFPFAPVLYLSFREFLNLEKLNF